MFTHGDRCDGLVEARDCLDRGAKDLTVYAIEIDGTPADILVAEQRFF